MANPWAFVFRLKRPSETVAGSMHKPFSNRYNNFFAAPVGTNMSKNTSAEFGVPQKIPFETPLPLENGQNLPRFDLMIETYGMLNAEKSNAVLICHALSGNHHVAGRYSAEDKYPGWWDSMVGPGKPIDTEPVFRGRS